jgi:DNA-binding transcriptional MerR regulator/uncharacterized protein (DUF433 family)
MRAAVLTHDPLLQGFYTVSEAARLLGIEQRQRIHGWLRGKENDSSNPIIQRDYEPINNIHELSFWDLMEVRFIDHFRKQGVSLQTLRKVADVARREFNQQHPFALSQMKFMTDRKRIFSHTVEECGDKKTRDILGNQYEMYEVIEGVLAKGVTFDPKSHLADVWHPEGECPNVFVDRRYAYGHPVISKRRVPTSALYRLWRAESGDTPRVASWYKISDDEVREAVEFETRLNG